MYINLLQNCLTFFFFFWSFRMCIHLLLRDHKPLPNSIPWAHPPHTKRQEPISNFNTITYFYIYLHLHKKTKSKQFILPKNKS